MRNFKFQKKKSKMVSKASRRKKENVRRIEWHVHQRPSTTSWFGRRGCRPQRQPVTEFYCVLFFSTSLVGAVSWWVFTESERVLPSFTGFYRVWLMVFQHLDRIYLVLLGFTGLYCVLMGFTEFYWVLPSLTNGFSASRPDLPSFTGFYWVVLYLNGFYLVLLGFPSL